MFRSNMSLLKRITVTYGTFVTANYMSNHFLFPDKKLDYGFLNRLIGREVNTEWYMSCILYLAKLEQPCNSIYF